MAKRYVALLRGINVGGKNPVPMVDLRAAFEAAGYRSVRTYIQTGNVVFESDAPARDLEGAIEAVLEDRFAIPLTVVVRSHQQVRNIVAKAPRGFGSDPGTYYSDTVFLKAPLTAEQAMRVVQLRPEVDQAWPGTGVIYFARLAERRVQSKMSKIVGTAEYQRMTIRNWNTTTTILALLDDVDA